MKLVKISNKVKKLVFFNLFMILFILGLFEFMLGFFLTQGPFSQPLFQGIAAKLYRGERNIVQYTPEFGRYDSELSYTLKPGQFIFRNREFANEYRVNHLGLRDDEESLNKPSIIVLGDSLAMGWGVEQEETFAQVIEKSQGIRVLNAAISSYGTAREIMSLSRFDCENLKYLIIQYCDNDFEENKEFFLSKNTLPIMSEEKYQSYVEKHLRRKNYYPGKYLNRTLKEVRHRNDQVENQKGEAEYFLNVLAHSKTSLDKVQIIVLETNMYAANDSDFTQKISEELTKREYPEYIENIQLLDVSKVLDPSHYFPLDGHLTEKGHKIIAEMLTMMMGEEKKE